MKRRYHDARCAVAGALAGLALGAGASAAAALLLYQGRGLLAALGVLIALVLAVFAAGLWAGATAPRRTLRWTALVLAFAAAAVYAAFRVHDPTEAFGVGGLAPGALVLLALPAYAAGLVFAGLGRAAGIVAPAGATGAAAGVALGTAVLIPAFDPELVFAGCAALIALGAAIDPQLDDGGARQTMQGRVVLVTGVGARGQLGFALARVFADAGAAVAVVDVAADVDALARELGDGVLGLHADLTDADECARVVADVQQRFGRLDALVNAAGGLSVVKPFADTQPDDWEREIARNARTAFLMSRAALPLLRESRGAIVNFTSPAAEDGAPRLAAYSAAKAALVAMGRALASEERGAVRVNAIAPGMIDTAQNRAALGDDAGVRWVSREAVADVALFLAGDGARGVNGEVVHVPGEAGE